MLNCGGKRGLVCIQKKETLTVFRGTTIIHTASLNQYGPDPDCPSFGPGFVEKMKVLSISNKRSDLLESVVYFDV
jgi:hypothetical protein